MALTEEEKVRRKERARRRREARAAGTYIPRKERKAKARKELATAVSAKVSRPVSREEVERDLRKRQMTQQDRIHRSTGWRPQFRSGEPVLVKARIIRPAYPKEGTGQYYVTPIINLKTEDEGRGWYVTEQHLTAWPRRKK